MYFSEKLFAVKMSGVQELRVEDVEAAVKVLVSLFLKYFVSTCTKLKINYHGDET